MPRFTVSRLETEQIAEAFPLVRMAVPGIAPDGWSRYAANLAAAGGAMLGVFAGDSTLHGIGVYRIEDSLRGRRLAVDAIVTFELNRAAPARAALVDALEGEAVRCGCASLALTLPAKGYVDTGSAKAQAWLDDGFAFDSVVVARPLEPAADQATSLSSGAEPR